MTIGNATALEVFWTLSGLFGFIISAWALNDAVADLRWLEASGQNGARHRLAWGNARDETIRVLIQMLFVGLGLVAMATAPANADRPITPLSFVFAAAIVAAQLLLVAKSVLDRRDRRWIVAYLIHLEEQGAYEPSVVADPAGPDGAAADVPGGH